MDARCCSLGDYSDSVHTYNHNTLTFGLRNQGGVTVTIFIILFLVEDINVSHIRYTLFQTEKLIFMFIYFFLFAMSENANSLLRDFVMLRCVYYYARNHINVKFPLSKDNVVNPVDFPIEISRGTNRFWADFSETLLDATKVSSREETIEEIEDLMILLSFIQYKVDEMKLPADFNESTVTVQIPIYMKRKAKKDKKFYCRPAKSVFSYVKEQEKANSLTTSESL